MLDGVSFHMLEGFEGPVELFGAFGASSFLFRELRASRKEHGPVYPARARGGLPIAFPSSCDIRKDR